MTMIWGSRAIGRRLSSLLLILVIPLAYADGPFDPTFAGDGLLPYSYLFAPAVATPSAIARDSLGRLFVATTIGYRSTGKRELAVTRHIKVTNEPSTFDGQPDFTFANANGIATDFFGSGIDSYATAVAVDHQDRIIVGGGANVEVRCPGGEIVELTLYTLVRLRNDGKGFDGHADLNFGALGSTTYGDCSNSPYGVAGLVVDKDDSIVAVGTAKQGMLREATVVRWTSNGQLDTTFGTAGVASDAFMGAQTIGTSVAIDGESRILVAGEASNADGALVGFLARYTPGGKLDTSFGSGGFVQLGTISTPVTGPIGHVCCVQIDSQNRAIVAGTLAAPSPIVPDAFDQAAFVARFTDQGMRDDTFGQHGFIYPAVDRLMDAKALAIDNKDRPVVGGYSRSSYYPQLVSALTHFNRDGSANTALGFGATYTAAFGFSGSYTSSVMIDPYGRPVMTAVEYEGDTQPVPVLIRYDELFGDGLE